MIEELREICTFAKNYAKACGAWGFEKHSRRTGLNVLFTGPYGTGKTIAAEIIASEFRLDLYRVQLSKVVSKYIGETEKNLNRIFDRSKLRVISKDKSMLLVDAVNQTFRIAL